jgi:hypothetical protein
VAEHSVRRVVLDPVQVGEVTSPLALLEQAFEVVICVF